jgi:hypothetical protein
MTFDADMIPIEAMRPTSHPGTWSDGPTSVEPWREAQLDQAIGGLDDLPPHPAAEVPRVPVEPDLVDAVAARRRPLGKREDVVERVGMADRAAGARDDAE